MIRQIIKRFLRPRHFWRTAGFDELSEIYIGMMFRALAISVIGVFIPVYLYRQGYDISHIALFYVWFFVARMGMDVVAGYTIARIGPKHTILLSYLVHVCAFTVLLTLPTHHWPLALPAMLQGAANSLFFVAYHVDFSKIKHAKHGGKELGYANMMERLGSTLGPFIGGLTATFFGAKYTFVLAIALMFLGAIPLLATSEPVKTRQHLTFRRFPLLHARRDVISYAFLGIENTLCISLWPFYLAVFVFTSNNAYAAIGVLTSASVVVSVFTAKLIGQLVDAQKGGLLLRWATITNACIYIFRPFTGSVPMALGINISNEAVTTAYRIPYTKGMYDAVEQYPGYRIAYFVVMEGMGSLVKALAWLLFLLATLFFSPLQSFIIGFGLAGIASLLINMQRFPALEFTRGNYA